MSQRAAYWVVGVLFVLVTLMQIPFPEEERKPPRTQEEYYQQADEMMAGFCAKYPRQCR
jgi:hypothetical protein